MMEEGDGRLAGSSYDQPRLVRAGFAVKFPSHAGIRAEVERAPSPMARWWRSRVIGGPHWRAPTTLPWSYGTSETAAVEAAISLWARAGKPRSVARRVGAVPVDERPIRSSSRAPATDENGGAKLIALGRPGGKPVEYQLRESVQTVLRAVVRAYSGGASSVALTSATGRDVKVELRSILELRDGGPGPGSAEGVERNGPPGVR